jgi:hypothetical protein
LSAALGVAVVLTAVSAVGAPSATAAPGPTAYPEYWFDQWNVPAIWQNGHHGEGITVAILDTGVQASVPELARSVVPGTDLTGLGGDGTTDRAEAAFSHGTAMASLIVAQGGSGYVVGVAPAAKVLPIAIPLGETHNTRPNADEVPIAIRYAADHGAKIISMSFGGERNPEQDADDPCPSATQDAVFYALRKGAILVASGGNSGDSGSPVEEPAVCLGVISVGAVDARDQRADFSSVHPYLTVAAPGDAITSLNRDGQVYVGSGTSQAAALTSGALALIWSAHPAESNRMIVARLMAGLRDAGPAGPDKNFGYGIVDADSSIAGDPPANTPNPVFTGADPFLKQLAATPTKLAAPAAVAAADPPTGSRRDAPPGGFRPVTLAAAGAGAVGLVALAALLGGGRRSRRRRPSTPAFSHPGGAPPGPPPGPYLAGYRPPPGPPPGPWSGPAFGAGPPQPWYPPLYGPGLGVPGHIEHGPAGAPPTSSDPSPGSDPSQTT